MGTVQFKKKRAQQGNGMKTIKEIATGVDKIGAKYQSEAEQKEHQVKMAAANNAFKVEAARQGFYDLEKGIWLV